MILSNKAYKNFLNKEFSILRNNKDTVLPLSKYFPAVGSTQIEDILYEKQISVKLSSLKDIWAKFLTPRQLEAYFIVSSPKIYEYRFRMDYVCAADPIKEPFIRFGQRKKGKFNLVVDMKEDVLIDEVWFKKVRFIFDDLMSDGIDCYDLVKHTGELRYLVLRVHDSEAMLCIVTKSDKYKHKIEVAAQKALASGFKSVKWLENSSINDSSDGTLLNTWGSDVILVQLNCDAESFKFQVSHSTFFQNNIYCFETILDYINLYLAGINSEINNLTLIDLYCGVGTLGIVFSKHFFKLIGIEIVKESVELAKLNMGINKICNAEFLNTDVSKLSDSDLASFSQNVVIVDPPRGGLGNSSIEVINRLSPKILIYISCNPITQAQDFELLKQYYKITHIRAFDMFPHTYHVENLVILERIKKD